MRQRRNGFALVTVLWTLVVLGMMAAALAGTMRQSAQTSDNLSDRSVSNAAIESGLSLALERLIAAKEAGIEPDGVWVCRVGETALAISLVDEAARLDLNAMSEDLLAALLIEIGFDREESASLAASTLDYRDADDNRREGGAEADDYKDAGLALGPKNAPFAAIDELRRVFGMQPAIIERLRAALTIYKQQPGIDPDIALPLAKAAMTRMTGGAATDVVSDAEAQQLYFRALYLPSAKNVYRITIQSRSERFGSLVRDKIIRLDETRALGFELLAQEEGSQKLRRWPASPNACDVNQTAEWIRSRQPLSVVADG